MKKIKIYFLLTILVSYSGTIFSQQLDLSEYEIPYEKVVLDNGLTLIVHEDHKAPIVAVNVWYHVGSKNEKKGKSGFAHLFEHLMFNGSENFDDDYFQVMNRIGATDLNGTTNSDRTNYFQNVPTSNLDVVLWMESDRMGHLLGAINQEKLDEQRGVVQNEKRQGENQPYGRVYEIMTQSTWPANHPYSWTVIGSMEDLDAASLEDVNEWFQTYYGAANAVITIAGDIDTQTAIEKVKQYFGAIPSGPPVSKHEEWIAKRTGTQRQFLQDRVPHARIYKTWNIPKWGSKELNHLDLVSDVLAAGKNSRLYKRLVYDDQIATNVSAYVSPREIAGQFNIVATAKPGVDIKLVEQVVDEELAKFLNEGPTEDELKRIKTQYFARFIRGMERIGGFGGKSDILAVNQVYGGSPDFYMQTLKEIEESTVDDLLNSAKKWLSDGEYILEVQPFPEFTTQAEDVDRSEIPVVGEAPEVKFPDLQRATLSNGMKVILAERKTIPVVNLNLMVDAGYAADQMSKPGTASLAMNMLDEGTKTKNSLQISEELEKLGATLSSGSSLDFSNVSMSALKPNLDESLSIFADVILNPSFPEADFNRLKNEQLVRIQQEKSSPMQMAIRVFPKLLYGDDHAYSNPLSGSGYESTVSEITREDLLNFHQTWMKPNNATIVVIGDITVDEIIPKLENLFKNWEQGDVPQKNISEVELPEKPKVFILDRPGSIQSIIFAGHIAPPYNTPEQIAIETMNNILGGEFTSRINMNLREDKHWSYGASSFLVSARGQRPFIAYAPVQSDKTKESMVEIYKELTDFVSTRPPTMEEFTKVQTNRILSLPGGWETMSALGGSISNMIQYGLSDDYYQNYATTIKDLKLANILESSKQVLKPSNLVWVIVGDRSQIEEGIRELEFGEIQFINMDGEVLQKVEVSK